MKKETKESETTELIKLILLKHDRVKKNNEAPLLCEHVFSLLLLVEEREKKLSTPIEIQTTHACVPAYLGKEVKLP